MIKECLAWVGLYDDSYLDEVQAWFNSLDTLDKTSISCEDYSLLDDDQSFEGNFLQSGGLFEDTKVILFKEAQLWEEKDIAYCLEILKKSDAICYIGFTYKGGEPRKKVLPYLTEMCDRRVPFGDSEELASWMVEWLGDRDVQLSKKESTKIAQHVGNQQTLITSVLSAFKSFISNNTASTLTYEDVRSHLGALGGIEMYNIQDNINSGNRSLAGECARRVNEASHPLAVLSHLSKTYRAYAVLESDPKADTEILNIKSNRAFYMKKPAQALGKARITRAIEMISDAENSMKDHSVFTPQETFVILIDNLTRQFAAVNSRRR